ncbi:MAG: DUF87 domain-containing protein [Candidatus Paceibacterota bacterium]
MDPERVTYFGETDSRNNRVKFGIKAKDRTRHVYVIGKTGMGKSTLLENMAIQDLKNGEGMAFMDPHGKTAELLLDYVPPERLNDIVYFAPFDTEYPISFNVLEDVGFDKRHLVVAGLMSTFKKIWVDAWSARMEYILNNTLLALIEYPGATLLGVNKMLADKDYRKKVVDNVKDPSVKSFWVDEFAKYTDKFAAEATPAIQNKIGQFTSNPIIRDIVGQSKSTIDIRKIMDEKKILIINLSKGRIGESNANLLGSMLITKIYLAAMSRADVLEKDLKKLPNFYLYVDEFQSFANESFADILSEARKYKLNLTIAHQYIEQMSEEVRAAVFGNVGTMITFRVGAYDADVLEKEFAPQFTAEDLVNLGMFQMYLKLMIDGVSSQPFSSSSLPPFPEPVISYKSEIIANSRRQFAQPKMVVEEAIQRWHDEGKVTEWQKKQDKVVARAPQPQTKLFNGNSSNNNSVFQDKSTNNVIEQKIVSNSVVDTIPKMAIVQNVSSQKKQTTFPPIESEPEDGFLPLKEMVKKITEEKIPEKKVENKDFKKQEIFNKDKRPNKQNLSDLKSALQTVLKNNNTGDLKDIKVEESKKVVFETPKVEKRDSHNKEIPEEELKKVLGIE